MATSRATASPHGDRQHIIVLVVLAVVVFISGILLGSVSTIGSRVRGWVHGSRSQLDFTTSQEIYGILRSNFDGTLDRSALQDGASGGLVTATGDRFSSYLTPGEWTAFQQRMNGSTIGIGVELGFKNGKLVIIAPQEGSPAKQAGLIAGDIILEVDGTAIADMTEQEAVMALRGTAGTSVNITVLRGDERLTFTVTRQAIVVPSVRPSIADGIGVIAIMTFDSNTARLAAAAAANFRTEKVRGIILDMRGNPGGAVTSARDVAGLWLPKGSLIMTEKRGHVTLRTYKTENTPVLSDIRTVILLNGGSASASEVVAGALRDYGKATIVGTQSFGKGSVQEIRPLSNGGALSFTVSRWFTPKGRSIDGIGLTPDKIVALTDEDAAAGRDPQMSAARELLGL
jgi:carboxyl-terminal processing protease